MGSVIAGRTLVKRLEVYGVLQGAILDESALGDVVVVLGEAHDKAEVDLGVGVELAGAQLDDVAHALRGAVHTLNAVVGSRAERR